MLFGENSSTLAQPVSKQFDYVSGTNPIYIGTAAPVTGLVTSQPVWAIQKLTYDGSGNVISIQWAVTPAASTYLASSIWDNRASLTYV